MAKMIAPRLVDGSKRDNLGTRLPASVKAGLRAIARRENKSVSWVIEEVIIDYFHLQRPRYVKPKAKGSRMGTVVPIRKHA